jgi:hypothetical protein
VSNATDPADTSSAERLDEVARILALGILRLRTRQSSKKSNNQNHLRGFGVDFSTQESVCGRELNDDGEGR